MRIHNGRPAALVAGSVIFSGVALAGAAQAAVTEFTSQSAFDTADPSSTTFGFSAGGAISVLPNPSTFDGVTFTDEVTPADTGSSDTPVLFLIDQADTPTYGTDFLSFQNTKVGVVAKISIAATTAFGFTYGSYVPTGVEPTLTLSTGESYAIAPTASGSFIGFIDTAPITSITVDYPSGFTFDVISVSKTPAPPPTSATPEPSQWLFILAGIGGVGLVLRAAKRKTGYRLEGAAAA